MNIILLIIDTLRYDHVRACSGDDLIRTPNLDRLAETSWVFDRAYAASYPTIPHRTDVITGQTGGPLNPWLPLRFDVPTLPALLAEAGYCTQLIHDTPHLVNGGHAFDYPFHAWTFVRGAEVDRPWLDDRGLTYGDNWARDPLFEYAGEPDMRQAQSHIVYTYVRANRGRRQPEDWNVAQLFLTAARFLRDNAARDDFFLWLDCFDPHEPWDAPAQFVRRFDDTSGYDGRIDPRSFLETARNPQAGPRPEAAARRLRACYSAKVSWMDHWLGHFLDLLEETGLAERTALIVTADHGTNVGERGRFGKSYPIHEQEGHVPLFVRVPDRGAGRSDAFAQPQDLFATALHIAGLEPPAQTAGRDLLSLAQDRTAARRHIALSGSGERVYSAAPEATICTVFAQEWVLLLAARPDACRLFRYGSSRDIATDYPRVVMELQEAGLEELARRGADARLLAWLRSEGTTPFPEGKLGRQAPAGWRTYWQGNYDHW